MVLAELTGRVAEGPQQFRQGGIFRLQSESGTGGTGIEYLENTVRHLDELGIPDTRLHELLRALER